MRHLVRFRLPLLALLTLALWLLPAWTPPSPGAGRVAFRHSSPREATAAPAAPGPPTRNASTPAITAPSLPAPPADTVFTLAAGEGSPRPYAVALDELYFPGRPAAERIAAIPAQPGLAALLAHAAARSRAAAGDPAAAPRLVLYPVGAPRTEATRRIVSPGLDASLPSASSPSPAPRPDLGVVSWERPAYAPAHAIARIVGDAAQPLRAAAALASTPGLVAVRPLLARLHSKKSIPDDPLFKDQWHLRNTGQQGGKTGVDIRAVPAWDTATGAGVVIGIVDDGLERVHPDLSPAYNGALSHDWNGDDPDPSPAASGPDGDNHGTAVAGLAAARGDNALGVAGAAPAATLAGLRLIGAETTDAQDADAMAWRADAIQVKNNSWGPPDASSYYDIPPGLYPAGPLWRDAVATAVATGRDGLGTLFFWSAGNGQADGDQSAKDGYASLRYVIAVAAVTNKGAPASFSEGGPHLVVAAPGDAGIGLVTTDRVGDNGYNSSTESYPGDYLAQIDYTKTFAGTSAAAPVASGVGALLLEARPDLGWRDIKEILLRSSTKLQPTSADWTTRAAGDSRHPVKHHPRLGGGLINALDALALARTWTPLAAETSVAGSFVLSLPRDIPEAGLGSIYSVFTLPADAALLRVEHLELTLDINHPYRGDLEITLTSPSGVVSTFASATARDSGADYKDDSGAAGYVFSSVRHWGEPSRLPANPLARWTLLVRDRGAAGDIGTLNAAGLTLYGTPITLPAVVTPLSNQALATGSTLVLEPGFSGGNLSYQWTLNGKAIAGATSATYRLDNFTAARAGAYACTATNLLGSAIAPAIVTVDNTPRETLFYGRAQADVSYAFDSENLPLDAKFTGLPPGLTFDRASGVIQGRPTRAGIYTIVLTYRTADGVVVKRPVAIEIYPIGMAGSWRYQGLVARDPSLNADLGGDLALTLNGTTGAVTGTLRLGAATHAISGRFTGTQEAPGLSLAIARGTLAPLTLALAVDGDSIVSGTVSDGTHVATVETLRVPWTKADPVNPAATGAHTFYLTPSTAETQPAGIPAGHGVGTLKVATDGLVTWQLYTADGAPALTGSCYVRTDGAIALFARAKSPAGSVLGHLPVANTRSGLGSGDLTWQRAGAAATGLQSYPAGIPLHLLDAGYGTYQNPGAGVSLLNTSAPAQKLAFSLYPPDADAPLSLPADLVITPANRITFASATSATVSLTATPANGRLAGTLKLPGLSSAPIAVQAVRISGQSTLIGYFLIPAGTTYGATPVSGRVEISPATEP